VDSDRAEILAKLEKLSVMLLCCTFDRGGVSLETEKGKRGTTSKLLITRAQLNDSGNYTCASSKVTPASVMVHVLNGEQNTAVASGKRMERDCAIANFEILHSAWEEA